jgi:hypothetical protein
MALGWADPEAPENRLATERVPARDFAAFHGFESPEGGVSKEEKGRR